MSKVRELTRKEALEANIAAEIAQLGGKQQMSMDSHLNNVIKTSLKMNSEDLEKVGDVDAKIGVGSPEQVKRAAKENWQYSDFSERIWADKAKLIKETRVVIEEGFARNKGAMDMATDLMTRMNVSHSNALRVVRTEFNHLSNQASLEEYKANGIKKYKFVAAIDNRTCSVCHELNGKEFNVADARVGVNFPPIHPNCRSVTVPVIDWEDEDQWDYSNIELDDTELAELGLTADDVRELDASAPKPPKNAPSPSLSVREANKAAEKDRKTIIKEEAKRIFDKTYEIKDVNGNVTWSGNAEQLCFALNTALMAASVSQLKDIENSNNENVRESLKIRRDIEQFIKKYAIKEGIYHINENSSYHLTAKDLKAIGVPANLANIIKECDYWLAKIKDSDLEETAKEHQVKKSENERNVDDANNDEGKNKPVIDNEKYNLIKKAKEIFEESKQPDIPNGTIVAMVYNKDFSGRKDLNDLYQKNDEHEKCFTDNQVNALEKSIRDSNKAIQITPDNLPSTMLYVDGGYKMLNTLHRDPKSLQYQIDKYNIEHQYNKMTHDMLVKHSDQLSKEIQKFTLPKPITVKRLLYNAKFLTMGLTNKTTLGYLIGREFTDKGFVSTSINLNYDGAFGGSSDKRVVMYIDVPAGAHAAYIAGIGGRFPKQKELLLDKGTRFRIIDAGERTAGNQNGKPVTELFIHAEVVL